MCTCVFSCESAGKAGSAGFNFTITRTTRPESEGEARRRVEKNEKEAARVEGGKRRML